MGLDRLQSADGTAPFDASLKPEYGVFHAGWTNWLRGGLIALKHSDAAEIHAFTSESVEIATAFRPRAPRSFASYPGQAWPAGLGRRDRIPAPVRRPAAPRFGRIATNWVAAAKTKLIRRRTAPASGGAGDDRSARASSQGIIQRFLVEIDPAFARAQYEIFKDRFVNGIGVREYPKGSAGQGDVDSGPLILGMSLSATVVAIGAARVQHDPAADRLTREGELLGLPLTGLKTKRYLFARCRSGTRSWPGPRPPDPRRRRAARARRRLRLVVAPLALVLWLPALILWLFVRFRRRARRRRRAH